MRSRFWLFAIMALAAGAFMAPQQAHAFGWWEDGHDGKVTHHVYRPRYKHVYIKHDPYGYHSAHVHYYPYVNSGYWRQLREVRHRRSHRHSNALPDYYSSWGHPTRRKVRRKHSQRRHRPQK